MAQEISRAELEELERIAYGRAPSPAATGDTIDPAELAELERIAYGTPGVAPGFWQQAGNVITGQAGEGLETVRGAFSPELQSIIPGGIPPSPSERLTRAGMGLAQTVFSPAEPFIRVGGNIARQGLTPLGSEARQGSVLNVEEGRRPSTGEPAADTLADLLVSLIPLPVGKGPILNAIRRLTQAGRPVSREAVIAEVVQEVPELQRMLPSAPISGQKLLPAAPATATRALPSGPVDMIPGGGMRVRSDLNFGQAGGIVPDPRVIDIVGVTVDDLGRTQAIRKQQLFREETLRSLNVDELASIFSSNPEAVLNVLQGKGGLKQISSLSNSDLERVLEALDRARQFAVQDRRLVAGDRSLERFTELQQRIEETADQIARSRGFTVTDMRMGLTAPSPVEITGFRAPAHRMLTDAQDLATETARRQEAAATIEPAKVIAKAERQRKLPEGLSPLDQAAAQARIAQANPLDPEISRQLEDLVQSGRMASDDLEYFSRRMFGEGRTAPATKEEAERIIRAVEQLQRKPGVIDPDFLEIKPHDYDTFGKTGLIAQFARAAYTSFRTTAAKMSEPARELVRRMDEVDNAAERRLGNALADLKQHLKGIGDEQKRMLFDAIDEGRDVPDFLQKPAELIRSLLRYVADEAVAGGIRTHFRDGKSMPFMPRDDFMPHMLKEEIFRSTIMQKKFVHDSADHMLKTGQAKTPEEAVEKVRDYLRRHGPMVQRAGNLERAREIQVPRHFYETDLEKVMTRYLRGAYRRLEETKWFGGDNRFVNETIAQHQGADANFLLVNFKKWAGIRELDEDLNRLGELARSANFITKLSPFTSLLNLSQTAGTALRTNMRQTALALGRTIFQKGEAKERALRSGAVLESVIHEMAREAGAAGGATQWYARKIGFNASEQFNRTVASEAGRGYGRYLGSRLMKAPGHAGIQRELRKLNVDPMAVMSQKGILSEEQLQKAAQKVVNDSQFRARATDLPAFWTTEFGKVVTQFKNFSFSQTKLLKLQLGRELVRAASGQGYRRAAEQLMKFVTLYPAVGIAQGLSRRSIRAIGIGLLGGKLAQDNVLLPEENIIVQALTDAAAVGSLGMFYDAYASSQFGPKGITSFIVGPTLGTGIEGAIAATSENPTSRLTRLGLRQIPTAGKFVPPAERRKKANR